MTSEVPEPGIDGTQDKSKFLHISFYHWFIYILILQAILFYTPRWLWIILKGGILKTLIRSFRKGVLQKSSTTMKIHILADYFIFNWRRHNFYARRYFVCLVLCMVNLLGQLFSLNILINYHILTYGINVTRYFFHGGLLNPMKRVFPRAAKCTFLRDDLHYDAVCVLPLNNIYDKFFLFLWFWFCILFILTLFKILFYLFMFMCPPARIRFLRSSYGYDGSKHMQALVREASYGDCFLLFQLGKNVDFIILRELMRVMVERHDILENSSEKLVDAFTQVSHQSIDEFVQSERIYESPEHSIQIEDETVEEVNQRTSETEPSCLEFGLKIDLSRPENRRSVRDDQSLWDKILEKLNFNKK